jgi:hypothetical protein
LKLDDKVKAITLCDGGKSCRAVANKMGDGRTQIMNILIIKRDILDDNVPSSRKHQFRVIGNVNINKLSWDRVQDLVY